MQPAEIRTDEPRPEPAERATRERGLFRNRNFRLFFIGQLISNSGTWLQNVAQGVLVLQLTGRSAMVGVANAALFLPVLFLALAGGKLADRFDRRRLLISTQVLAMAATGSLAALAATGHATVAAVVVVALLVGVQYAVSIPTMQALLPSLVPSGRLGQAIGLNSVTYNLARVVGPILATGAIAGLGFAWAFGLNSLSFVALIVALLLIRVRGSARQERTGGSIREALGLAWRNPRLRLMFAGVTAVAIATDPVVTLAPAFVRDVFHRNGAEAGFVVTAFGIGSILAAAAMARAFRGRVGRRLRLVAVTMAVYAAGLVAFAWIPSFWPALVALAVGGMGYLASSTTWTTAIQEEVADHLRGRIMGVWTLCFLGSRPLASLVDGTAADLWGPRVAVLVVAAPLVLVALAALRLRRPAVAET